MIKELINEKENKDEQKLLRAIHENYRSARMERQINEQLQEIESKQTKKKHIIGKVVIALLIVAVMFVGYKYNENQIKSCMEAGHNENFCRYSGE